MCLVAGSRCPPAVRATSRMRCSSHSARAPDKCWLGRSGSRMSATARARSMSASDGRVRSRPSWSARRELPRWADSLGSVREERRDSVRPPRPRRLDCARSPADNAGRLAEPDPGTPGRSEARDRPIARGQRSAAECQPRPGSAEGPAVRGPNAPGSARRPAVGARPGAFSGRGSRTSRRRCRGRREDRHFEDTARGQQPSIIPAHYRTVTAFTSAESAWVGRDWRPRISGGPAYVVGVHSGTA